LIYFSQTKDYIEYIYIYIYTFISHNTRFTNYEILVFTLAISGIKELNTKRNLVTIKSVFIIRSLIWRQF